MVARAEKEEMSFKKKQKKELVCSKRSQWKIHKIEKAFLSFRWWCRLKKI